MKTNIKFFGTILLLLLASSVILTGCMYAIAAEKGRTKSYDMGSRIENSEGTVAEGGAPTAQAELQKKFYAMYHVSDNGKSITVISEDYLSGFWQSCYEKEVIHSFTTDEVLFIIQDSIRIYQQYETIVLPAFAAEASAGQIAERFPFVEGQVIDTKLAQSHRNYVEDFANIYDIILYRLTALSSPKAFITGAEVLRFVGKDPREYNGMYPDSAFYIPGYSEKTDRDYILSILGGSTSFTDLERWTDVFIVSIYGVDAIALSSKAGGTMTQIFPTAEMQKKQSVFT